MAKGLGSAADAVPHMPTSQVLRRLVSSPPPAEEVTLGWIVGQLSVRSFGIVLLLLGLCGMLPVISPLAGILLTVPAVQMLRAQQMPTFPRRLARLSIPSSRLIPALTRTAALLEYMERFVRPRWATPLQATKRVVGGFILFLGASLLAPIPLSNVPIGLTIVLLAFAYLEEDGVLLVIALLAALGLLAAALVGLWGAVAAASWIVG